MGHKVHPIIHRTQVIYTWDSRWFSKRDYPRFAKQDIHIREYLEAKCKDAHIDSVSVERSAKQVTVTILAGKPGVIIGRGGEGLEVLRKHIERKILQFKSKVKLNVQEVRNPALSARIVAMTIAQEAEQRMPFRRSMKQAIQRVMKAGGLGVKISMGGRLNGAEIARTEKLAAGKVPLITLRSAVDYATVPAQTMFGKIGIKVWIYHGEVFGRKDKFAAVAEEAPRKTKNSRESREQQ